MTNSGFGDSRGSGARAGTTLREEETTVRSSRPVAMRRVTSSDQVTRDRVRWGPIWAGLVVTVATYILLQLALFGSGLIDADFAGGINEGALLSALVGLVAFVVGGVVTGATAQWRHVTDGILNAIVMWGLAIVSLIILSVIGGGFAAGSIGEVSEQFDIDTSAVTDADFDSASAADTAREGSANALLAITLALVAAAVGGAAGAKMWPGKDNDKIDLRDDVEHVDAGNER